MSSPAVVIGVGNRLRHDDGVGPAVVDRLQAATPEGVRALALGHVPPDLYEEWEDAGSVFMVDASASGAAPGTVLRLDAGPGPLSATSMRLSTHGFGLPQAIELARALDRLPPKVIVFAVEGGDFQDGEGLSPPVALAAGEVVARILSELEETDASRGGLRPPGTIPALESSKHASEIEGIVPDA